MKLSQHLNDNKIWPIWDIESQAVIFEDENGDLIRPPTIVNTYMGVYPEGTLDGYAMYVEDDKGNVSYFHETPNKSEWR